MKKRNLLAFLLSAVLLLNLTACGGASKNEAAMDYAAAAPMENGMLTTDSSSTAGAALPEDRKLIRTISMDAEENIMKALRLKSRRKSAPCPTALCAVNILRICRF